MSADKTSDRFASPSNVTGYPLGLARRDVPIEIVRTAFHNSGLSIRELARRLKRHHSSVGRAIAGHAAKQYHPNADGEVVRYESRRLSMSYDLAVRYMAAMGMEPAEVRAALDTVASDEEQAS